MGPGVRLECRRRGGPEGLDPARRCSSMVERQLPKLDTRVRFPSPAQRMTRPPTRFSSGVSSWRLGHGRESGRPPASAASPREGSRHRLRRRFRTGGARKPPSGPPGRHDEPCSPGPPAAPPRPPLPDHDSRHPRRRSEMDLLGTRLPHDLHDRGRRLRLRPDVATRAAVDARRRRSSGSASTSRTSGARTRNGWRDRHPASLGRMEPTRIVLVAATLTSGLLASIGSSTRTP